MSVFKPKLLGCQRPLSVKLFLAKAGIFGKNVNNQRDRGRPGIREGPPEADKSLSTRALALLRDNYIVLNQEPEET